MITTIEKWLYELLEVEYNVYKDCFYITFTTEPIVFEIRFYARYNLKADESKYQSIGGSYRFTADELLEIDLLSMSLDNAGTIKILEQIDHIINNILIEADKTTLSLPGWPGYYLNRQATKEIVEFRKQTVI